MKRIRGQPLKLSDITWVMVPSTQKRMMIDGEEHPSSTIKGVKYQPRRAFSKKHLIYYKRH